MDTSYVGTSWAGMMTGLLKLGNRNFSNKWLQSPLAGRNLALHLHASVHCIRIPYVFMSSHQPVFRNHGRQPGAGILPRTMAR